MNIQSTISKISMSVLVITGLLLSSCYYVNRHNGSGNVTRIEHPISGFNAVDISIVFDAVIIPSSFEKVIVEIDDNLQQDVLVSKIDSTLKIHMKNNTNIGRHSAGKVYVYTKGIKSLSNGSVGNLTNEGTLEAPTFNLNNSAVGTSSLKIKAAQTTIDNSAVGKTNLYVEGVALNFTNSAVGKTILTGSCIDAHINNSGVGTFDAQHFITQTMHIVNSAVGSTDVTADKEFYIDNSAVGRLDVYGKGVIKKLDDNGISKTHLH
jgi:hypothetical protein